MLVYFGVYLLTLLLCILIPINDNNKNSYFGKLIIVLIPLFLFGALREQFSDQNMYEYYFNEINQLSSFVYNEDAHHEIGFQWLCFIIPNFRTLLVLSSALMCLSISVFFYKNVPPKSLVLAVSLLFLCGNYSIFFILSSIRSGIVISMFILAFSFWQDRKIVPAILVTLLVSLIHTSALFALPLAYFVGRNTKMTKQELFVWIAVMAFFIFASAMSLTNFIEPIMNNYFDRYDPVIEAQKEIGNTFHPLAIIGSSLMFSLLALFSFQDKHLSKQEQSIMRIAMIFVIAPVMTSLNARFSQYYSPFIVVASAIIYARFPKSNIKTFYLLFAIAYLGYSFYLWTQSTWFNYDVYHSVLGSF